MKEIDDNLLTTFLEGKLDEATAREIEAWYDASEANRHRLETLYFVLFTADRLEAASKADSRAPSRGCARASRPHDARFRNDGSGKPPATPPCWPSACSRPEYTTSATVRTNAPARCSPKTAIAR